MKRNIFNSIKLKRPKSNAFDLTHDVKMSGRMGWLMPIMLMDCVPGDRVKIASETLVRFAPILAPIMHRCDVTTHYFFVPNRILWEGWEKFITNDPEAEAFPTIEIDNTWTDSQQRLADYLGLPPNPTPTQKSVSALPFAAYQCVYNEYYRDQNLVTEVDYKVQSGAGNNVGVLATLRKRAWEHDYFTSSLPFAQKGQAVDIPLGEINLKEDWSLTGTPNFAVDGPIAPVADGTINQVTGQIESTGDPATKTAYDPDGSLEVQATTINDLRRAFKLQEWLERNARGGTRYIEQILAHFGVRSSDARLQRPEYIVGSKAPVVISEVLNTTGINGELPQGNMAGHGVSVGNGKLGSYYVEEHGYVIGIMSIMAKPAYQQGIPKHFIKTDPLDFYWPSFAHIGEQEVKVEELYAYGANPDDTFGYVPRYAEYKYVPSRVAGEFRTTLQFWHLGRIFATEPTLSQQFIECDPEEVERIFAVADEDNLYIQHVNQIKAIRQMPVFGTPML